MKRIRCKECGMSIEVKEGQFFVTCPICNARTNVTTAEIVPSIDDAYDVSDYSKNTSEHDRQHIYVDRVEEEKKAFFQDKITQPNNETPNKIQPQTQKKIIGIVFVVIFVVWMIIVMTIGE